MRRAQLMIAGLHGGEDQAWCQIDAAHQGWSGISSWNLECRRHHQRGWGQSYLRDAGREGGDLLHSAMKNFFYELVIKPGEELSAISGSIRCCSQEVGGTVSWTTTSCTWVHVDQKAQVRSEGWINDFEGRQGGHGDHWSHSRGEINFPWWTWPECKLQRSLLGWVGWDERGWTRRSVWSHGYDGNDNQQRPVRMRTFLKPSKHQKFGGRWLRIFHDQWLSGMATVNGSGPHRAPHWALRSMTSGASSGTTKHEVDTSEIEYDRKEIVEIVDGELSTPTAVEHVRVPRRSSSNEGWMGGVWSKWCWECRICWYPFDG